MVAAPGWLNGWAELVFHVLAHVRGTAGLAPSLYDAEYIAQCEAVLGPASERVLGEDATVLANAMPTHGLLAVGQLLAWLFASPERAAQCADRDLAALAPADVDRPEFLHHLAALGAPVELLRAAALLEQPSHARLPPPQLDFEKLSETLRRVEPLAPLLGGMRVSVSRALRLRGRVVGDELWVGLAPSIEHMGWQAAHEATVSEVMERGATISHDAVERRAVALLRERAERAGQGGSHRRWLLHFRAP
jgi:hypothetical protein